MSKQKQAEAPAAKKTTEVAVPPKTAVVPTSAGDFAEFAGAGFEGARKEDYAIPFLAILQGLSPEVKRSDGAYIEGAQEGMIINTVTRELIDTEKKELIVVPCAYQYSWVEWRVREKGGGFVREYRENPSIQTERDDKNREIMPNGNQLNDTRTFYVLVYDMDSMTVTPAVIAMTSTQIKKARQWYMQMNLLKLRNSYGVQYTPPLFASMWRVSTVPESNEKGSWYGWKFEHVGYFEDREDPAFQAALAFAKSIHQGEVKADMRQAERVDPETGEVGPGVGADGHF